MRATLRAAEPDADTLIRHRDVVSWFDVGERLELPELDDSTDARSVDPTARGTLELHDPFDDQVTDPAPIVLRLVSPDEVAPSGAAPSEAEPEIAEDEPELVDAPEEDLSTGRMDGLQWDEADPYSTGEFPSLPSVLEAARSVERTAVAAIVEPVSPEPRRISLVQRPDPAIEEDYAGVLAAPAPTEPRPRWTTEVALPAPRPVAVPPPWYDEAEQNTLVVIDPTLPPAKAGGDDLVQRWMWRVVAWAVGFVLTFVGGAATTTLAAVGALVLATR